MDFFDSFNCLKIKQNLIMLVYNSWLTWLVYVCVRRTFIEKGPDALPFWWDRTHKATNMFYFYISNGISIAISISFIFIY